MNDELQEGFDSLVEMTQELNILSDQIDDRIRGVENFLQAENVEVEVIGPEFEVLGRRDIMSYVDLMVGRLCYGRIDGRGAFRIYVHFRGFITSGDQMIPGSDSERFIPWESLPRDIRFQIAPLVPKIIWALKSSTEEQIRAAKAIKDSFDQSISVLRSSN
jgi:hypothetical protein